MLSGLAGVEGGEKVFHQRQSINMLVRGCNGDRAWFTNVRVESGDAVMPLFQLTPSFGSSEPTVEIFVCIHVCVVCSPARVGVEWFAHCLECARIQVHAGTTYKARGVQFLGETSPVGWRGGDEAGTAEQGIKILGTPLGHPDFVQNLQRGQIISFEWCLRSCPKSLRRPMTMHCGCVCQGCWTCLLMHAREVRRTRLLCLWLLVGWDFAVQFEPQFLPIGPVGETH